MGTAFYESIAPQQAPRPKLQLWNDALADELRIPPGLRHNESERAAYFSGSKVFDSSQPIALAYAGHQFGHFNPQLGDGRAHLLGEIIDSHQQRRDIQLKGSGPTRFSRRGDGRCALKPAVREFIMSEAMHALGVPTTRSLAVVTTGEQVFRDTPQPGAVITRVAASHIRVGTFEYFAAQQDWKSLATLADYTIKRHFPKIDPTGDDRIERLLESVIARQIELITQWMRVGFIHGVMNTDNTAISGETIDYGPCAMLGAYNPSKVYSAIDTQGRYAFANQPIIGQWNMARFAESLLPLIDANQERAIERVGPMVHEFVPQFKRSHQTMLAHKLGLAALSSTDAKLISGLLQQMQTKQLDYTQTFHALTQCMEDPISHDDRTSIDLLKTRLGAWFEAWQERLGLDAGHRSQAAAIMRQYNPVVIPRNHHMEHVLSESVVQGHAKAAENFLAVLRSPYQQLRETSAYQDAAPDRDNSYQTFCGT
jgi:uncharacterized protein YdiU (UPF0061 family)